KDFSFEFTNINLDKLTELEKNLIEKFFYENKTIREISKDFNISTEKARQIKQKAIMKLKKINRNLTNFSKNLNKKEVY
ncbi:MAG: hypothetical protein NZ891_03105, partial [bacterium]|nr:hypothetical protein [bacterium]MDW8163713.1 sigma factor-like helix-turn-helix DNA-binding protein [Candidatus Omnitrophota bacterium]